MILEVETFIYLVLILFPTGLRRGKGKDSQILWIRPWVGQSDHHTGPEGQSVPLLALLIFKIKQQIHEERQIPGSPLPQEISKLPPPASLQMLWPILGLLSHQAKNLRFGSKIEVSSLKPRTGKPLAGFPPDTKVAGSTSTFAAKKSADQKAHTWVIKTSAVVISSSINHSTICQPSNTHLGSLGGFHQCQCLGLMLRPRLRLNEPVLCAGCRHGSRKWVWVPGSQFSCLDLWGGVGAEVLLFQQKFFFWKAHDLFFKQRSWGRSWCEDFL